MTEGYEYWLMGESSRMATAYHSLPSFDTATLRGVRGPLARVPGGSTWLYTSSWRPSFRVTASVPELLLGSVVLARGDQVLPWSVDHVSRMARSRLRHRACRR